MGDRVTWVEAITAGVADQLRTTIDGASSGWDFQIEPGYVITPSPPTIDVYPADPGVELATTGGMGANAEEMADGEWINVRARVAPNDPDAGQEILMSLMSADSSISVVQALYDDPTIGGLAADTDLVDRTGFVIVPRLTGQGYDLGVVWRFLILPAWS